MFFGILDHDGEMDYINAGHPSPFLIRHGVAEEPFTEGSYPVGLVQDAEYVTARVKLEPGDTLILFSDGVTEAMDPGEELYGVPRLREVLTGQSDCALDKLQKSILESVENFSKGAHQADDLTLLIVRYRATPAVAMVDTDISSSSSGKSFAPTATITGPGPGSGGSEVALQPTLPSPVAPKIS
jgi:sigma-B regulation protein RsbU (phosphoserine phosphatase)